MQVLVTGANGFLGYYLIEQLIRKNISVIATGRGECRLPFADNENFVYQEMDFTDPFKVHDVFENFKPDAVVHAGAMSKPDECEANQWLCYISNVEGTLNLLMNAEEVNAYFLFVSTDFVFDGEKGMYGELDKTAPVNFYGKTKVEGEEAVMNYAAEWAIVRTVLVYGNTHSDRKNILSNVKEKLEKGEIYQVVNDQVRTPTYVEDLAATIVTMIEKKANGIFHISGKDIMTPFDMAIQTAEHLGLNKELLKPVSSSAILNAANRPLKTGFLIEKAIK